MQKTYDDCYLICSTAVYFEKQNNEQEALRAWRNALDHIYYTNAYKIPANYKPRTETERALQESLHEMEMQCKERVDLLDTLQKSRRESQNLDPATVIDPYRTSSATSAKAANGTIGQGTIPAVEYSDLGQPSGPSRQSLQKPLPPPRVSQDSSVRSNSVPDASAAMRRQSSNSIQVQPQKGSRTPSPEKRPGMLKATLRSQSNLGARPNGKLNRTMRDRPPAAAAAATLAWPSGQGFQQSTPNGSSTSLSASLAPPSTQQTARPLSPPGQIDSSRTIPRGKGPSVATTRSSISSSKQPLPPKAPVPSNSGVSGLTRTLAADQRTRRPNSTIIPPKAADSATSNGSSAVSSPPSVATPSAPAFPSYRKEYTATTATMDDKQAQTLAATLHGNVTYDAAPVDRASNALPFRKGPPPPVPRKAVGTGHKSSQDSSSRQYDWSQSSESEADKVSRKKKQRAFEGTPVLADNADDLDDEAGPLESEWDARVNKLMKNLPRGVDEQAAKAIFNEIVIKGDEVHWDDVAGLDVAKNALKEAVVYPFLRPDLFMGLREPARGMLLFGPPGTGKTMLARAVATESRSTFFAISASSLTSKYMGESEKLVRALFSIAKALTPSIIFVDEIDSLLSARSGSGEHEATRRIKTEFLIQWSDLAKAAAGREDKNKSEGDASRVLVLAATNLPWAIDEAARRRFVRRQYIPLPEPHVRESQMRKLMSAQKHCLTDRDFARLVRLTDGFSGSDITALAKDAAMGPLRSLGENLLHMSPDEIRPIGYQDFEASLVNIRPSVSKQGLKEFEDWAREFGERGG